MQPWFTSKAFDPLRGDIEDLVDALSTYKAYLVSKCSQVQKHHQSVVEPCADEDKASLITISGLVGPASPAYCELEQKLECLPLYKPLYVNGIAPCDRYDRRKWVNGMQVSFPIMLYKYAYGNRLGTLIYVWCIPVNEPVDSAVVSRVFSQLSSEQKFYSTRATRKEFMSHYSRVAKIPKMLLRNIYRTLLNDEAASSSATVAKIDERVAQAVISINDPDIVLDLRKANGNPKSTTFDRFWQEVQAYLEMTLAVDDRRHGEMLHMPLAISVRHLHEQIIERLRKAHPEEMPAVPSEEWIRLQFWPTNPYTSQALRYSGHFQVKFGVQIRQLRKDHPDRHYVSALLQYVRHFSVLMHNFTTYMSVDDKAIVPVGEPNAPVSTGVRGHNRSLVPSEGPQVEGLDHDFHLHGIVPSVAFRVHIPDNANDSFYTGEPFVTNKNKVTQPSSALRHATEIKDLLLTHCSDDQPKPILVVVSDGGPDHRVTFGSVKVVSLALFKSLNLDMLICVRTCPYQSWQNIAERVMSTFNLALQNVSIERSAMPPEHEQAVKGKNTLTDIRGVINKDPTLEAAIQDSMAPPMALVGRRFQSMKIKENCVKLGVPATEQNIDEMFQHVLFVDPSIPRTDHTAKGLQNAKLLHKFLKTHCHCSHYVFQIKKCEDRSCFCCLEHPVRLPQDFSKLSFLPLPLLEHFQKFDMVYGKPPSEDRPSYVATPSQEAKENDKKNSSLLVSAKELSFSVVNATKPGVYTHYVVSTCKN